MTADVAITANVAVAANVAMTKCGGDGSVGRQRRVRRAADQRHFELHTTIVRNADVVAEPAQSRHLYIVFTASRVEVTQP